MKRKFVCNRWPFLEIGNLIKFQNGLFVTDDPNLIATIEGNEAYGAQIVDGNTPAEIAAAKKAHAETTGEEPEAPGAGVTSGLRGTGSSSTPKKKK